MMLHLPDYFLGDLISTLAFGIVAILLIVVAVMSGLLSLGVLKQSQPADLLR